MGLEMGRLGRAGRDGGAAGEHGGALFGEVFVEMAHGRAFMEEVPIHCWDCGACGQPTNPSALMRLADNRDSARLVDFHISMQLDI
jgi:hypothetical protein